MVVVSQSNANNYGRRSTLSQHATRECTSVPLTIHSAHIPMPLSYQRTFQHSPESHPP